MNNSNSGGQKEEQGMAGKASLEELRRDALDHYEELSRNANHWSSFVNKAILAYDPLSEKKEGPVLRWVKAGERLPKVDGRYPCKENGEYFTKYLGPKYKGDINIEWLDDAPESPSLTRDGEREEGERKYSRGELLAVNAEYEKYVMKVIVDSSHPQPAMRFGIWFDKNFPIPDKIYRKNCGLGFWECKLSCRKWEPTALYNLAEYGRTAEGKKEGEQAEQG